MKVPGFTAEESLYATSRHYRAGQASRSNAGIQPATTPQECYRRDSNCTQFCGRVQDPKWRYECFSRCDIYLNNCLDRGVWTDRAAALIQG